MTTSLYYLDILIHHNSTPTHTPTANNSIQTSPHITHIAKILYDENTPLHPLPIIRKSTKITKPSTYLTISMLFFKVNKISLNQNPLVTLGILFTNFSIVYPLR